MNTDPSANDLRTADDTPIHLIDYLERQLAPFEDVPFNPVDAAALSQLCMVRGEGAIPLLPITEDDGKQRAPSRARGLKRFAQLLHIGAADDAKPVAATVPLRDLLRAENFPTMFTGLNPEKIKRNLFALAASPRFRAVEVGLYLSEFDPAREMQFAAMTFFYRDMFAFVGFRGTDESIVGWKEDFNMAYAMPVPAQDQASRYLAAAAPYLPERIIVGGHSKGGNLAEYAALHAPADVQNRIVRVYNLDGPGFKEDVRENAGTVARHNADGETGRGANGAEGRSVLSVAGHSAVDDAASGANGTACIGAADRTADRANRVAHHGAADGAPDRTSRTARNGAAAGATNRMADRTADRTSTPLLERFHKIVPAESIVGILLHAPTEPRVVRSSAHSLDQHSVFSWEVNSSLTDFSYLDALPTSTAIMAKSLQDWLGRYDDEDRARIVDALFRAIEASGAENARDLLVDKNRAARFLREAARNADETDRDVLIEAGRDFLGAAAGSAATHAAGRIGEQIGRSIANLMNDNGSENTRS